MRLRRRVRITVRSESAVAFVGGAAGARPAAWCAACGAPVAMLTPDEAAAFAGVSTRHVFRSLEAGGLHFVESAGPGPLVCLNSAAALAGDAGVGGPNQSGA